jgi:hypothetical protein
MFNPTRDQSRQFLFDLWVKHRAGAPLRRSNPALICSAPPIPRGIEVPSVT